MLNITARGFDLKQGVKDGIDKELKRVEKMLPETAEFDVTISKSVAGYKVDITVKNMGSFIRGEHTADRIQPAIDFAVDDLKRKVRKLKTQFVDKKRKSGIDELAQSIGDWGEISEPNDAPSTDIKRTKRVILSMMTDDEAIVQMEMLGHTFFIYLGEDGKTRTIYKRKNGYGLLICE